MSVVVLHGADEQMTRALAEVEAGFLREGAGDTVGRPSIDVPPALWKRVVVGAEGPLCKVRVGGGEVRIGSVSCMIRNADSDAELDTLDVVHPTRRVDDIILAAEKHERVVVAPADYSEVEGEVYRAVRESLTSSEDACVVKQILAVTGDSGVVG